MAMDIDRISNFLEISPSIVHEQQWPSLLNALLNKAIDHERLTSEKLVLEVQLEQTNRHSESRLLEIQQHLSQSQQELAEVRAQQNQANVSLPIQADNSLASEVSALKEQLRIAQQQQKELLNDKKQAMAMVDRQSQADDRLKQDYTELSERYKLLRQQFTEAETQLYQARAEQVTIKHKEQTWTQELDHAQQALARCSSDVEKKSSELVKCRETQDSKIRHFEQRIERLQADLAELEQRCLIYQERTQELGSKNNKYMLRCQELQDQSITKEEAFRNELAKHKKLAELWERSTSDAKSRIAQLQETVESLRECEGGEIAKLSSARADIQQQVEHLESRNAHLEELHSSLEAELELANERLGAHDGLQDQGIELLSPSAHIISRVQKSSLSLTQLYAQFLATKQSLEHEKRKNHTIQRSFDDLIVELESRAPQLQEQRDEFRRSQNDLSLLTDRIEVIVSEKDELEGQRALLLAQKDDQTREIQLYQAQVLDLSRQIQKLLLEIEEQGFRSSPLSEAELTALNNILATPHSGSSAVENLISERLVLFKNIQELQQQNQQQLKVIRQLGQNLEQEEEQQKSRLSNMESAAVSDANTTITKLNHDMQVMQAKLGACVRERDMYKRISNDSDVHPPAYGMNEMRYDERSVIAEELKNVQSQFDAFRTETKLDHTTLTNQLTLANAEKSNISIELARLTSQLEFAEEKYRMSTGNIDMMRKESEEYRKRSLQFQDTIVKQEYRLQQESGDLITTRSLLSSLQSETANLKAERQLIKSIERRAGDELASVRSERDRLNSIVIQLQALQSEREASNREAVERYKKSILDLEASLEEHKTMLLEERAEVRRVTNAKEQGRVESVFRVEELSKQTAELRQSQAVLQNEKDNLQARQKDVEHRLQACQDQLRVHDRSTTDGNDNSSLTMEQRLQVELSEVKTVLESTKKDLQLASERAEHMQSIASSAEEALESMNTAHDDFVVSVEGQLATKSSEVLSLQQRVNEIFSELETANQELVQVRESESEKRKSVEAEKYDLHTENQRLRDIEERFSIAETYYRDDLRNQAEIAQEAQQNYENELVKHAEAAQTLRALRSDYTDLRTQMLTLRNRNEELETSNAKNTSSWTTQKDLYEQELSELRLRMKDLSNQNEIIHDQLDSFAAQYREKTLVVTDADGDDLDSRNMREIVRYLRREKEIVDISYELLQQEHKRAQQKLEMVSHQFDECQLALMDNRQQLQQLRDSQNTVLETTSQLHELTLTRESNITLRAENTAISVKLSALEAQLSTATLQLEPLRSSLRAAEAEIEVHKAQSSLLTTDNERWKQRNQAILQKYERIDPLELQQLREKAQDAEQHAKEVQSQTTSMKEIVTQKDQAFTALQEQLNTQVDRYDKLMNQTKERIGKERKEAKEARANAQALVAQVEQLTSEILVLKQEVQTSNASNSAEAEEQLSVLRIDLATSSARVTELESAISQLNETHSEQISNVQRQLADLKSDQFTATIDDQHVDSDLQEQRLSEEGNDFKSSFEELAKMQEISDEAQKEVQLLKTQNAQLLLDLENARLQEGSADRISSSEAKAEQGTKGLLKSVEESEKTTFSEEQVQERIEAALASQLNHESIGTRQISEVTDKNPVSEEVSTSNNVDEMLASRVAADEHSIQMRIDEAVQKARDEFQKAYDSAPNQSVEEIIKAKDEEMKIKVRSITKERVDQIVEQRLPKKIESARQEWLQGAEADKQQLVAEKEAEFKLALELKESEFQDKLTTHGNSVRKECTMRSDLQLRARDKQITALQDKLTNLEKSIAEKERGSSASGDVSGQSDGELEDAAASTLPNPSVHEKGAVAEGKSEDTTIPKGNGKISRGRNGRGRGRGGTNQGTKRPRDETGDSSLPSKKAG